MTTSEKAPTGQTAPPAVKETTANGREPAVAAGDAGTIKDRLLNVFKRMTKRA
jgi:hypothetical protein